MRTVKNFLLKNKFSIIIACILLIYTYHAGFYVDIQLHDTYYVIGVEYACYLMVALILIVDLIYYYLEVKRYDLSRIVKIIHTITAVLALTLGTLWISLYKRFTNSVIYSRGSNSLDEIFFLFKALSYTILGLLGLTLILIIANFIRAFWKGIKKDKPGSDDSILDS